MCVKLLLSTIFNVYLRTYMGPIISKIKIDLPMLLFNKKALFYTLHHFQCWLIAYFEVFLKFWNPWSILWDSLTQIPGVVYTGHQTQQQGCSAGAGTPGPGESWDLVLILNSTCQCLQENDGTGHP